MKNDMTIKRADNGTYYFRANLGTDPVTGKRIQKYKSGFKTKKEAKEAYAQLLLEAPNGSSEIKRIKYGQFVDQMYLPWYKTQVKESSYWIRCKVVHRHTRYFSDIYIDAIDNLDVYNWQLDLIKREYSQNYIRHLQQVHKRIFDRAVILGFTSRNPFREVGFLRKEYPDLDFWTVSELKKALSVLDKTKFRDRYLYVSVLLLFMSGMRKGEAFALLWSDLDFETNQCSITKSLFYVNAEKYELVTTKTKASRRTICLDSNTMHELAEWKNIQQKLLPKCSFVLSYTGGPSVPTSFPQMLNSLAAKAGVHKIRVHDLRHSHAAMLINMGENMIVVKERLGHSEMKTTLGVYGHLYPNVNTEVANRLADIFKDETEENSN